MKKDLVSIITPLYNCKKYIKETIDSVLDQTYDSWEMIIIDDCSTDGCAKIVKEYVQKDKRIKLIQNKENVGVTKARNKGIEIAKGRYIAFLDSDDIWSKEKLKIQIDFMVKKKIPISFTAYEKMDGNGKQRGVVKVPNKITYKDLLKTNIMGCLTVIYDTKLLGKRYFSNLEKSEDYALWLEILKEINACYGLKVCLARYRVLTKSRSSNKLKAIGFQWKIYREKEKLKFFSAIYYFLNYLFYGYKRYKI